MPPSHQPPIPSIKSYAEALEVHLSNLDTRLVATLDTLDEITRSHEIELENLQSQANSLHARCQGFKARAEEAEAERDGLKRYVNKLVEKVEKENDHRVLPSSRIYLPHPLGSSFHVLDSHFSLTTGVPHPREEAASPQPIRLGEDVHSDAYLPAILNSLNAELTAEKYAFSELRRVSEARIATLEAQVARRDAEAAAYKSCSCRFNATSDTPLTGSHKPKLQPAGTPLSQDQAQKAFKTMAIRQRTLEIDLDGLRRKLHLAQSATPRPKFPHPLPRLAPHSPGDTSVNPRDPLTRPATQREHPDTVTHPVLSHIDRQLVLVGRAFNNLHAERDNVHAEVDTDGKNDGSQADDQEDEKFRAVLLIEEECIRLRKSERSLRQELLIATATASATEQNLKLLVNKLQRQIHKLGHPGISGDSAYGEGDTELQEAFLKDVSSEPTITKSVIAPPLTPPLHPPTLPAQAPTVPPLSRTANDGLHSYQPPSCGRPPSAPPFFKGNHTQVQRHSTLRLARIETELNQARIDVKEKDRAIHTLRAQLSSLRTSVQVRTRRESGGPWRESDGTKNG